MGRISAGGRKYKPAFRRTNAEKARLKLAQLQSMKEQPAISELFLTPCAYEQASVENLSSSENPIASSSRRKSDPSKPCTSFTRIIQSPKYEEVTASKLFIENRRKQRENQSTPPVKTKSPEIPCTREIFSIQSIVQAVKTINVHAKSCQNMNFDYESLVNVSLSANLKFKCTCGFEVTFKSNSGKETHSIDYAVSLASTAVPISLEDLRSLFTILDVTPPSRYTTSRYNEIVQHDIQSDMKQCLKDAAEEEKRLAVEKNAFITVNGIQYPSISVVCDGSWSKRSYGHSYDSNYGMGAIIGAQTKKVLYVDIRQKYCRVCKAAEKTGVSIQHRCYKNWTLPSTGMESDVILQGFKQSIPQQGLVYSSFVADGDSSTYAKVKDVYPGIEVQKIECINHVIRNLNSKLRNIASNTVKKRGVNISQEERRIPRMENRFRRVGLAVQAASTYYNARADFENDWKLLREDILNIPHHIFGRHTNCKDYFQCSHSDNESDIVDLVRDKPMYQELLEALTRVANLSASLIRRQNSNIVECFFSIVAKYLEGKRKNLGGKSLYLSRVTAAVLSFNKNKFWVAEASRVNLQSINPGWKYQHMRAIGLRKKKQKKRSQKQLKFSFLQPRLGDEEYGLNPDRPDLDQAQLDEAMKSLELDLQVTPAKQLDIEALTRTQAESQRWHTERFRRITASEAGKIFKLQDSTDNEPTLRRLLTLRNLNTPAIKYGKENEQKAIWAYEKEANLLQGTVLRPGLVVSQEHGCLAASPDGLIGSDGLLEVKSPYTLKSMTLIEWVSKKNSNAPIRIKDGAFQLKKDHDHYFQVVMQIYVTGRAYCDYFIWSERKEYFMQRINRTEETNALWEKMKTKLLRFWKEDMLPELADSRIQRKKRPRVPEYRQEAVDMKFNRKKQKGLKI